jgi:small subunit ribosomal protein S20
LYYARILLNMPIIKSAAKKLRQSAKHQLHNQSTKRKVKEVLDLFKDKPSKASFAKAASFLDKAAKTKLFHPNKAARLKSRLAKLLVK